MDCCILFCLCSACAAMHIYILHCALVSAFLFLFQCVGYFSSNFIVNWTVMRHSLSPSFCIVSILYIILGHFDISWWRWFAFFLAPLQCLMRSFGRASSIACPPIESWTKCNATKVLSFRFSRSIFLLIEYYHFAAAYPWDVVRRHCIRSHSAAYSALSLTYQAFRCKQNLELHGLHRHAMRMVERCHTRTQCTIPHLGEPVGFPQILALHSHLLLPWSEGSCVTHRTYVYGLLAGYSKEGDTFFLEHLYIHFFVIFLELFRCLHHSLLCGKSHVQLFQWNMGCFVLWVQFQQLNRCLYLLQFSLFIKCDSNPLRMAWSSFAKERHHWGICLECLLKKGFSCVAKKSTQNTWFQPEKRGHQWPILLYCRMQMMALYFSVSCGCWCTPALLAIQ